MTTEVTLKDILQMAVEKEIGAQQLYGDLSRKVTESTARDVLQGLVREEHSHQELLERYLNGELESGALQAEAIIDYKIAEETEATKISPDMALKDIFLVAANREKIAHESYLALSQAHPNGEVKTLLEDLASQELGHKHKLETLYTEVAFPQTAGG